VVRGLLIDPDDETAPLYARNRGNIMTSTNKTHLLTRHTAVLLIAVTIILITSVQAVSAGTLMYPLVKNKGSIGISSVPYQTTISLDNRQAGVTPTTITGVTPGQHTIVLTKAGYEPYTQVVTVQAYKTTSVYAVLLQKPIVTALTGTLKIASTPLGAAVYLDNKRVGVTPCTISRVSTGEHTVLLIKAGYELYTQQVTVEPGKTTPVYALLLQKSSGIF
jgi:hypothetical protein